MRLSTSQPQKQRKGNERHVPSDSIGYSQSERMVPSVNGTTIRAWEIATAAWALFELSRIQLEAN